MRQNLANSKETGQIELLQHFLYEEKRNACIYLFIITLDISVEAAALQNFFKMHRELSHQAKLELDM